MTLLELRNLLTWWMVSDPWPDGVGRQVIEDLLDRKSREAGFLDWTEAYHKIPKPSVDTSVAEAAKKGFDTTFTDQNT